MTDLTDDALIERLYSEGCTPEEVHIGLAGEPGPYQWHLAEVEECCATH